MEKTDNMNILFSLFDKVKVEYGKKSKISRVRCRKALSQIKALCVETRKDCLAQMKAIPKKKREKRTDLEQPVLVRQPSQPVGKKKTRKGK